MMCCFYIKTPEVYQRTTVFGYATGILDFLGQFGFLIYLLVIYEKADLLSVPL